jgi:alanyl-tRNA synthetase
MILHRGQELLRVVGVVAGDLRAQLHLAAALFDELTHLLTGDFRQILGALVDQVGKLMQHRQALVDVAFRPVRMVKRIGRLQRRFDIRVGM